MKESVRKKYLRKNVAYKFKTVNLGTGGRNFSIAELRVDASDPTNPIKNIICLWKDEVVDAANYARSFTTSTQVAYRSKPLFDYFAKKGSPAVATGMTPVRCHLWANG